MNKFQMIFWRHIQKGISKAPTVCLRDKRIYCQVLQSVSKGFLASRHTWSLTNKTSSFSGEKSKELSHEDFG